MASAGHSDDLLDSIKSLSWSWCAGIGPPPPAGAAACWCLAGRAELWGGQGHQTSREVTKVTGEPGMALGSVPETVKRKVWRGLVKAWDVRLLNLFSVILECFGLFLLRNN